MTSKLMNGENIYATLERLGWKRTNGNSRVDYYRKNRFIARVPKSIEYPIRVYRASNVYR